MPVPSTCPTRVVFGIDLPRNSDVAGERHQEIPYGLAVEIESRRIEEGRTLIHAVIWVERESHKRIVIGSQGNVLKRVGQEARLELNGLLHTRVHLEMWVKVREHWSDNAEELKRLGYDSA
jgi:GTP-binding protein Era